MRLVSHSVFYELTRGGVSEPATRRFKTGIFDRKPDRWPRWLNGYRLHLLLVTLLNPAHTPPTTSVVHRDRTVVWRLAELIRGDPRLCSAIWIRPPPRREWTTDVVLVSTQPHCKRQPQPFVSIQRGRTRHAEASECILLKYLNKKT